MAAPEGEVATDQQALVEVLERARRFGFLGDRQISEVIDHSRTFVDAIADTTGSVLDLGSGAGVPGLVIALDRPDLRVTLLDRRTKRTDALQQAVRRLRWSGRVQVVAEDVEDFLRGRHEYFDVVVARGFGPPDETLRIAASAVREGGRIVISEPPPGVGEDRWTPPLLHWVGVERNPSVSAVACFTRVSPS